MLIFVFVFVATGAITPLQVAGCWKGVFSNPMRLLEVNLLATSNAKFDGKKIRENPPPTENVYIFLQGRISILLTKPASLPTTYFHRSISMVRKFERAFPSPSSQYVGKFSIVFFGFELNSHA